MKLTNNYSIAPHFNLLIFKQFIIIEKVAGKSGEKIV